MLKDKKCIVIWSYGRFARFEMIFLFSSPCNLRITIWHIAACLVVEINWLINFDLQNRSKLKSCNLQLVRRHFTSVLNTKEFYQDCLCTFLSCLLFFVALGGQPFHKKFPRRPQSTNRSMWNSNCNYVYICSTGTPILTTFVFLKFLSFDFFAALKHLLPVLLYKAESRRMQ